VIRHGGNDKARMTNDECCRGVCVKRLTSEFGAWHKRCYTRAFTLIELLVVIAIIIVLAGLILSTVGYVQKKGGRSRAETEIAAMSAACESYKADNGVYPRDAATSDVLDARSSGNPTSYESASLYLYTQLSGTNANRTPITGAKPYFTFKPNQLSPADQSQPVEFIRDPFGNSYGYSTAYQGDIDAGNPPTHGYNPTFDLWSTAGLTDNPTSPDTITPQWIKNW
jgi:prepilin-type N-terminal cleavage/methylation domain-containing protein